MSRDERHAAFVMGMCVASFVYAIMGILAHNINKTEKNLMRFCMTHSISLEQCKIPEEGK
jgi:hypothetical protein